MLLKALVDAEFSAASVELLEFADQPVDWPPEAETEARRGLG